MPRTNPGFEAATAKAAPFARPILKKVRYLIHRAVPEIEEDVKWNQPAFIHRGDIFAILASFKKHCAFILWRHKLLAKQLPKSEQRVLRKFRRITVVDDLPKDMVLLKMFKATRQLHEAGVKSKRRGVNTINRVFKMPAFLNKALTKNAKARTTFAAFSYSNKQDYVEWLTGAKTSATRLRRLRIALNWLAEGKPRHWKYQKRKKQMA